jgi:hypothetical protein
MITDEDFLEIMSREYSFFYTGEKQCILKAFVSITDYAEKLYNEQKEDELRRLLQTILFVYGDCSPLIKEGIENIFLFRVSYWPTYERNDVQHTIIPKQFLNIIWQMRYMPGI